MWYLYKKYQRKYNVPISYIYPKYQRKYNVPISYIYPENEKHENGHIAVNNRCIKISLRSLTFYILSKYIEQ